MLLNYLWQATGSSESEAQESFSRIVASEAKLYRHAWGRPPHVSLWNEGRLFLGQLRYDMGIDGFESWVDCGTQGIMWGGVCESFLGQRFTPEKVAEVLDTVTRRPRELVDWDGRFSVFCWDRGVGRVILGTGATQSTTLWYSEGPKGWGVSSRATPLLELVGRPRVPNKSAMHQFLAFGFLAGSGCFFEGVDRIPSRQTMTFDGRSTPHSTTYADALEILRSGEAPRSPSEALEICKDRLIHRVGVEHRSSRIPTILLTGGRDSRLIAAAAARSQFSGWVHSGGSPESSTVRVAGNVAAALGVTRHPGWGEGFFDAGTTPAYSSVNLRLWTRLSEGVETIRHALTWQDFFARSLPCPARREVSFHGLAGEFGKGANYRGLTLRALRKLGANHLARDRIRQKAQRFWLGRGTAVSHAVDQALDEFENEIRGRVTVAEWLELFSWQRRSLQWGDDQMLVRSPIGWMWTPLQDRILFQVYFGLSPRRKFGARFVEELTVTIAPELKGVKYDKVLPGPPGIRTAVRRVRRAAAGARRRLRSRVRPARSHPGRQVQEHSTDIWDAVFAAQGGRFRSELLDRASLRDLIRTRPAPEALWNLATVELFLQSHF